MPKIPLYNQGLGQTVTTKPIQGVRANEGAFTASQKGFSALGGAIEDAAFKFGMEEKKAETDRYRNKVNTDVNQEMNNFTMNSEATTVAEYQALADKKRIELRDKHLSGLEGKLTKNQFRDVSMQFDNTFAAKVATGSQQAHNKAQAIRTDQVNTTVDDTLSQLRSLDPSSQLYQDIQTGLDEGFDRWASQGIRPKYSKTTYRRELSASRFVNDVESATSQTDIDKLRSNLEAEKGDMSAADYAARTTAIDAQEKVTDTMQVDAAYETIIQNKPDATDDQLEDGIQTIRDGKTLTITTNAGEEVVVDFGTMKPANRAMLIARIEAKNKSDKAEILSANLNSVNAKVQNMSLSELRTMEQTLRSKDDNGDFVISPDIKDFPGREQIRGIVLRELAQKARRAVSEAGEITKDIVASVTANKGVLSEADNVKLSGVLTTLMDAEQWDEAAKIERTITATSRASTIFQSIKFDSLEAVQTALKDARSTENMSTALGSETYQILSKQILERNKLIQKDFVGYYKRENPDEEITPSKLLTLQTEMGIAAVDLRVTSDAELASFKAEYDNPELNYNEKAAVMDSFLNRYGQNQNRVMRHLMETNTISFAQNIAASDPTNINMKAVLAADTEKGQKEIKEKLSKDTLTLIKEETATIMQPYGNSITGSLVDDVMGGGASPSRVFHSLEMQTIVSQTAAFIHAADASISAEKAVEIAYDTVIGNKFVFENVNGSQVRINKDYEPLKDGIREMLDASLTLDTDHLAASIEFPPTPFGRKDEDFQREYLKDLKSKGSWRTTTDNTGVYLVDQLGNLVQRKAGTGGGVADQLGFVSVNFDSIVPLAEQYQEGGANLPANLRDRKTKILSTRKLF